MYEENEDNIQNAINSGKSLFDNIGKNWKKISIPIAIIFFGYSSFYQIEAEEVGVVLSFGKYVRTVEPGLHFKIPYVEKVKKSRN